MWKFSIRELRLAVLGVSAAPLVITGCGRTLGAELDLSEVGVIPSKDGGRELDGGRPDSGVPDAGFVDAGAPDAGDPCFVVKGPDAGWIQHLAFSCGSDWPTEHHGVVDEAGSCYDSTLCQSYCGAWAYACRLLETPEPSEVVCWQGCVGRLIDGATPQFEGEGLGGVLANMAAHEGAAAIAFAQLAHEVGAHGLPSQLVDAARRAAHEERQHTRLVGSLARSRGGHFDVRRHAFEGPRALEAIALENAQEGCVRETLGAMVGLYQSLHARDAQVREVMARVSSDELGHAAWSHAVAATLEPRLELAARRRVREARAYALSTAAAELARSVDVQHAAALGFPDEEKLHALARALS